MSDPYKNIKMPTSIEWLAQILADQNNGGCRCSSVNTSTLFKLALEEAREEARKGSA